MKKKIAFVLGLALCLVLAVGIISSQAEEQKVPDKYITVGSASDIQLPDGSEEYYIEVQNYGDEITLPESPFVTKEASFKGWIYNAEFYQPGDKVKSEEGGYLTAVLVGNNSEAILALDPENGGWSYTEVEVTDDSDSDLLIPSIYENFFAHDMVDEWFEGWFDNADGTGKEYTAGNAAEIKKGDLLVLYAVWSNDLTQAYKIEFDMNHSETEDLNNGYCYVKKGEGIEFMQGIEIDGYELEGWYDKPEGGNLLCKKDDEAEDYVKYTPTGDTVLYAHWVESDEPEEEPSDFPDTPFVDVSEDSYFCMPVKWAAFMGITSGTDDTHFSPASMTTRAQMVTFLWRAAGEPVVNYILPFTDVNEDSYYAEAVRWAVSEGITTGTDETTFSPNANITREQLATFIYRYAQKQGRGFENNWAVYLNCKDADQISSWSEEALKWCIVNGIIYGVSEDRLDPKGSATRGQIVTMLYRYFSTQLTTGDEE